MKLSKRLQTIYDMVPKGLAADVGADHGKLIISLFKNGIIEKGYAIENKKGPYQRLVQAIKEEGVIDNIIPLLSDGIRDIPDYVHTVIIAGMGGDNILKILNDSPKQCAQIHTLIIDAHSSIPKLRKEISELGFVIADEKMVLEEDKYYEIIKFIRSDIAFYGDKDIEFGPILRNEKSATFKQKYENRLKEIDYLLGNNNLPQNRIDALNDEKKRIKGIL